jgi:hypothetical protein
VTRRSLGRLALLGVAAGAVYALRVYLQDSTTVKQGDVQIVLDTGATVEPNPSEAQELVDIARKVLEVGG